MPPLMRTVLFLHDEIGTVIDAVTARGWLLQPILIVEATALKTDVPPDFEVVTVARLKIASGTPFTIVVNGSTASQTHALKKKIERADGSYEGHEYVNGQFKEIEDL